MLTITKDQIPYQLAYNAHRGTSLVPDERALQIQEEYVSFMTSICDEFAEYSDSSQMEKDLEAFRTAYVIKYTEYLRARANCLSTMVTGGSNFPTHRAQKANDREQRLSQDLRKWRNWSLEQLRKQYNPQRIANRPIETGEPDAIALAELRLSAARALQETMKKSNRICRSVKMTDDEKVAALCALDNISESTARELLTPHAFTGKAGFAPFQLSNNNAKIKRLEGRIADLKAEQQRRENPANDIVVNDVTMTENYTENRLQILFPDKPSEKIRRWLKSRGFRWAPSQDAWQRKLTENARVAGRIFMDLLAARTFDE